MSILNIQVKYTGPVPGSANMRQSQFNQLVRETWYEVGAFWHTRFLKKHFTPEGADEYDYSPRSDAYTEKKRYTKGHKNPLEWSGSLKSGCQRANITATATASGSTCKVTLPEAWGANFKNTRAKHPIDMVDELTRVSDAERAMLVALFDEILQGKLDALEYAREVSMPISGFESVGTS